MPITSHRGPYRLGCLVLLIALTFLVNLSHCISDGTDLVGETHTAGQEAQEDADSHSPHAGSKVQHLQSIPDVNHEIVARQQNTPVPTNIGNNQPTNYQLPPGSTLYYSFQALATPQPQARQALHDEDFHDSLRRRDQDETEDEDEISQPNGAQQLDLETSEVLEIGVEKRQASTAREVWISINTCFMPNFTKPQDIANPPQLSMAYRTARGPGSDAWRSTVLEQGFASFNVTTDNSVIIQITSPEANIGGNRPWNFDLAASRDGPYHSIDTTTPVSLKLIDSDAHAGLLITQGLGNWTAIQANQSLAHLEYGPPLGVFANNINYTGLNGLRNSFCALSQLAQIQGNVHLPEAANSGVEMGLTHAQPAYELEEQFYVPGLNRSSLYLGQLNTINGTYRDPVMGGGGVLYPVMNFTTKSDENCAVIYNLTFCDQVNYAVPANPARHSSQSLVELYDKATQNMFQNFSYSLQQIPCNTTPSSQYSLAVNCTDCKNAYKKWLCAVTIPKCEDFSTNYNPNWLNWDGSPSAIPTESYTYDPSPAASMTDLASSISSSSSSTETEKTSRFQNAVPSASPQPHEIKTNYLFPRNLAQKPVPNSAYNFGIIPQMDSLQQNWIATNSSRNNDTIGEQIQPGPYMEVLPCKDLCYDLVRTCPAALGFSCPEPDSWLESMNYGTRNVGKDGAPTCNAPGAVYYPNAAGRPAVSFWLGPLSVLIFCIIV
ncbi:MAG: hypothetical protein Q9159_005096 [Coniocarpon cinnabarinum]